MASGNKDSKTFRCTNYYHIKRSGPQRILPNFVLSPVVWATEERPPVTHWKQNTVGFISLFHKIGSSPVNHELLWRGQLGKPTERTWKVQLVSGESSRALAGLVFFRTQALMPNYCQVGLAQVLSFTYGDRNEFVLNVSCLPWFGVVCLFCDSRDVSQVVVCVQF